ELKYNEKENTSISAALESQDLPKITDPKSEPDDDEKEGDPQTHWNCKPELFPEQFVHRWEKEQGEQDAHPSGYRVHQYQVCRSDGQYHQTKEPAAETRKV